MDYLQVSNGKISLIMTSHSMYGYHASSVPLAGGVEASSFIAGFYWLLKLGAAYSQASVKTFG